jgi:hypothetical protein
LVSYKIKLKYIFLKIKTLQSIQSKTMNSVSPEEIIELINGYQPNVHHAISMFLTEISDARLHLSPNQLINLRLHLEEILRMILPRRERRDVPVPVEAPPVPVEAPPVQAPPVQAEPIPVQAPPVQAPPVQAPPTVQAPPVPDQRQVPYNPVKKVKAISETKLNSATPDICSICHDTHQMSAVATMNCCGQHIGHDCLKGWIQTNQRSPTCPCCRRRTPTFVTYRGFNKKNSPKIPAPRRPAGHPFARYDYIDFVLEYF